MGLAVVPMGSGDGGVRSLSGGPSCAGTVEPGCVRKVGTLGRHHRQAVLIR